MVVEIKNLVKKYKDFTAVDGINLSIGEGEIFGLLGPNGAGKTTTMNALMGLTGINSGEIRIFGKCIRKHGDAIKREIGIVPQDIALYGDLTAYENVCFFAKLYGLREGVLKERVKEALEFVGLWDRRKDLAKTFSGGMKRRLNIACAIAHRPRLIIMDEPTVGIDPQSRNHIMESVKELNRMGSTILYTSHYMEEVEELCTNIAIMDHGRVIAKGTKDALKSQVATHEKIVFELSDIHDTLVHSIRGVEGVTESIQKENQLTVMSRKGSRNLSRIIDKIAEFGKDILSLNIEKPTLETVFLTLTGRTLRD